MAYKNKEDAAAWRLMHRERLLAYLRNYSKVNKKYRTKEARLRHVKRKYNLDANDYLGMILQQNNVCAICLQPEDAVNGAGDVRPLCVDHDHSTGKVRGLLCNHCNALLGHAKDNITTLENSIEYLKRYAESP